VDMHTMVIVGSSTTRKFAGGAEGSEWVYTPRWYQRVNESAHADPSSPEARHPN
jgi:cobalt-precorrin 5A hydrolase/precorrin-3B C17-methyltransferase